MFKAILLFLIGLSSSLRGATFFYDGSSENSLLAITETSSPDSVAPVVIDIDPTPESTISELTTLEVVFDENVSGVGAGDLLINGVPAVGVNEISPRDYTFSFSQPAPGTVNLRWADQNGIVDLASVPNAFAGGAWNYTLDTAPPAPIVVISEFMADNGSGIKDDDAKRSDWIELFNMGSLPVNLEGWFLSVDPSNPTQWKIPAVSLNVNSYLLIWASEKNRTNPGAQLHTNFKLSKEGGYLGLFDANTNVVSEFLSYPAQQENISFGRDSIDPNLTGYQNTPTPRARNSSSGPGFAPEPVFSRAAGVFTNTSVAVSLSAPAGQIRYTLNGAPPSATSSLYTNVLTISTSTTIKARVYQPGLLPSAVIARNYMLVDSTVAGFSSNLPLMIFSTSGHGIVDHVPAGQPRTFASLAAIDTFRGRSSPLGQADYFGQCEMGIRGQTSAGFPKKPYRVELQDAYRSDLNASFFGLPAGADWVLNNPYSDKPFLQNFLAQELFEKMGHYAVRRRFVEVFINTAGGRDSYPRDYAGIYILLEKIKVDENRVNIAKLSPYDTTEPDISGGYMFKKDKDSAGDLNFSTSGGAGFSGQALKIHEPSPATITTGQTNWLRNYLNRFEKALYAPNWLSATGTNHYSYYIDADSFVDYQWIVEFSKQIDGYRLSNYMSKDRNGKVKMEPIWDWNLSFGNADYADGFNTSGWYYSQTDENSHIWFQRLMFGTTSFSGTTGDPDFNQKITDRWSVLRTNVFAASNVLARVDQLANILTEGAVRDFKKWPRLGQYIWPNPSFYVTPTNYAGIITAMKNWISGRYTWIDSQFLRAPVFSLPGGAIPADSALTITDSAPIYYTMDGSDPRVAGGAISSEATLYAGAINLRTNTQIMARGKTGAKWSGPTTAAFVVHPPTLIISELMYHPSAPPAGSIYAADDFEFVELKNSGAAAIPLGGYRFSQGIDFTFPPLVLGAGQRILVVKNRAAFESRYGLNFPIAGEYSGNLDNHGERLTIASPSGSVVVDFSYADDRQPITDGAGFSLVLADENITTQLSSDASQWRASSRVNGSPGGIDALAPQFPRIVVNELLSHPPVGNPDLVELQNLSPVTASIGGWFLTDDVNDPKKYRIPNGTIIGPGSFYMVGSEQFSTNTANPFGFSALGESIYIFSGDEATNLTGYRHGFDFGAQKEGVSFGRYVDSVGREHFVAQNENTFAATNSRPLVPPIIVNEIMFHPRDVSLNGALWNNTEDEYIELWNRTDQPISMFDLKAPTNTWKISGGVDFTFPTNTIIRPRGYLVLVSFDPAANAFQLSAFRTKFNLSENVQMAGPFAGHLDNKNGSVSLLFPDAATKPSAGAQTIPYVLAETIDYSGDEPGSAGADGFGLSLNRINPAMFGDDPANWTTALPSPGTAYLASPTPILAEQPSSQNIVASQTLTLRVSANSPNPLFYQWRFNGNSILNATNNVLVIPEAQPNQSGTYTVVVLAGSSSIASDPAQVTVDFDSDGDGIPDSWETAYGTNPFDASDATTDLDSDGISNLAEFLSGTNPRDPSSCLKLVQSFGGILNFTAMANHSYTVQYTESLDAPAWRSLTNVPAHIFRAVVPINDLPADATRYYRIVTPAAR